MIRKCTDDMLGELMEYLKQDAVYHTFLLADIENFGFDKDFQTVCADVDEREIRGVYLKFYGNLIVAGGEDGLDEGFLRDWFKEWKPDVVMGRDDLVEQIHRLLPDYDMAVKNLYLLEHGAGLLPGLSDVRKGIPGDEDKIHAFLAEIPEIRALYTSKQMIADRLASGDGTHLYLERDGSLIAHVNSAAKSPYTVMIGGTAVREEERGKNTAAYLVSMLCREILESGKKPCCFCDREEEHNLFVHLGFRKAGLWGTLTRRQEKTGGKGTGSGSEPEVSSSPEPEPETAGEENRLPSYIPVYNQLYQDIIDGIYEKDSLLPSENMLAAAYKVSRNTLRQALTILCQDGYIYKRQGKGTYVSYDCGKEEKQNIYNFLKECAKERIVDVTADHNTGQPTRIAKRKLCLSDGEEVLASNNVYFGEDGPVGQSFLQIPMKVLKQAGVKVSEANESGLMEFMESGIYKKAAAAQVSIQIMEADEQVVPYMNLPEGTILLHMEQILYGQDESPIARIKYFFIPEHYQVDCRLQA